MACEARDAGQLPLAVHIGGQSLPLPDILDRLRPGDLVTNIFKERTSAHGIFDAGGRVLAAVYAAQERGAVFR